MSYKVSSQKLGKDPVKKVLKPTEPSSSPFARSVFNDFLNTLKSGDIHAKRSQKEIKKLFVNKKSSKESSSVYSSNRSGFYIHNRMGKNI